MVDRCRLLELGHHRGAAGHQLLEFGDVAGMLDERKRHPVDAERQAEVEVLAVLRRHGRQRQHEVGQVDALAVADLARHLDFGVDRALVVGDDLQPHLAVVDQQQPAGLGRGEDLRMEQGDALGRGRLRIHVEAQLLAFLELHRLLADHAQPQFGPLQIHQDGDRVIVLLLQGAQLVDPLPVVVRHAVAEVEAEDVGAGLEQLAQAFVRRAGGPEGGDDLGESLARMRSNLLLR